MKAPVVRIGVPRLSLVAKTGRKSTRSFPAPLVPRDVDLRELPYMPVHIDKLLSSEFHATVSADGWRAGFCLWLRSFHEVPAASIPDDDVLLARLADMGRDMAGWHALKHEALHGWTLCSDGRWYHKLVAEKALEAWIARLCTRHNSSAGNAKRWQGGDAATVRIEKQITAAHRALKSLEKYDGNFVSDSGHLTALYKAEKVLRKSTSEINELDLSARDSQEDSFCDPLTSPKPKPKPNKKEEGCASANPPPAVVGKIADNGPVAPKPRRGRASKANTPWPDDFVMTDDMTAYAKKVGFDPAWLFEKFHNKALAKGWEYRDWTAAFRNFATTERSYAQQNGGSRNGGARRAPDV